MPTTYSKFILDECHEVGHTWNPSCRGTLFDILFASLKFSFKIYSTLYMVSFLVGRKGMKYLKERLLQEIVQSTLFLSSNAAFYCIFFCLIRKILRKFYVYSTGFLPGFFASLCAILVERKSRRGTLAVYMLNQAFDTIFNSLKASGLARDIEYGEVLMFSISMAIIMYMFNADILPDGIVKKILQKCFREGKKRSDINNLAITNASINDHVEDTPQSNVTIMRNGMLLGGKVFFIGSSLHTLYSMVISIPKLFKKPNEYIKVPLRKDNFSFGAWLGSYVCIFDTLLKFLRKYNKAGGHINAAVAGGVAGVSMMWHRSSSYALYIASKTIELVYMSGIENGVLPYYKHFDSLLYAICTAIMFHTAMLQPLNLKPAYFRFLENLTGSKFITVDRERLDCFGYDSSRIHRIAKLQVPISKDT